MSKYMQKCNPFSNVTGTGVATVSLLTGPTYKRILLKLAKSAGGDFTKTHLADIKVKVNSKTIMQASGNDLDRLNRYRGIKDAATFLTIDFAEIRARTINGEMLGALDTSKIQNFTLEVKIAGATSPILEAWAEMDDTQAGSVDRGVEFICAKIQQYPVSSATAGKFVIDSLPKGSNGTLIKRIHVIGPGGQNIVNALTLKQNGLVVFESPDDLNRFRQGEYERAPVADMFTLDFIMDGNQSNMLDTRGAAVRNLLLELELAAAGQMYVYVECVDAIGNL